MRVDLEAAKSLRNEGFTYEEIAFRLGCSKAWCAKHLGNTPKGSLDPSKLSTDEFRAAALEVLENAILKIKHLK